MTSPRQPHPNPAVLSAANWIADRRDGDLTLILPTVKARFDLTESDAADAVLLAGKFSLCRRAFA